ATLALVEDGFIILASNQRFEIDPAPMQIAGHAAAGFRITAQGAHQLLQFGHCGRAILRTLDHGGFQLRILEVFSALAKAFLAVFAGFDQIVEYRNRFFRVHSALLGNRINGSAWALPPVKVDCTAGTKVQPFRWAEVISSSIQVGAWSLACSCPRTQRSTPASFRRGARSRLSNR